MGLLDYAKKAVGFSIGEPDAIADRGRRRPPKTTTYDEDYHYRGNRRRKMQGTARDVHRNFAIAAWAVRKHLDYVSSFRFQSKTGDKVYDKEFEAWMAEKSRRHNCDIARRHSFGRMIRLAEAQATLIGDHAFLKLAPNASTVNADLVRGRLQAIEGDRICWPNGGAKGFDSLNWTHGIRTSAAGAAKEYMICKRGNSSRLEFQRVVPASSIFWLAKYDRFDQIRGVGPITASLNSLQDVYEGFDYALAKMKVAQLFGLALFRAAEEGVEGTAATTDTNDDGVADSDFEVSFNKGPMMLDLDHEDRAEFLEAKTPAMETVNFLQMIIAVSLKALDIPYSFFDESFTNFYGSRGGLIQYQFSCRDKILNLREFVDDITRWFAGLDVESGALPLPSGRDFSFLKWQWVPAGVPWWDTVKEVRGHKDAIKGGLDNPQRVCHMSGTDYFDNIDKRAEAEEYAAERGIALDYNTAAVPVADILEEAETDGN